LNACERSCSCSLDSWSSKGMNSILALIKPSMKEKIRMQEQGNKSIYSNSIKPFPASILHPPADLFLFLQTPPLPLRTPNTRFPHYSSPHKHQNHKHHLTSTPQQTKHTATQLPGPAPHPASHLLLPGFPHRVHWDKAEAQTQTQT
jgi:hypothetical protein